MATFATELVVDTLPPRTETLEALLAARYPAPTRILHWAIVKAEPGTWTLWIEGSLTEA